LVKLAMRCDGAEQLGEQLRRRRAEGELTQELDRLLVQD
jgi:hypothetical protein